MKLVFATHNKNKAAEVKDLLPSHIEMVTLTDIGCHDEIPETGGTLQENALIKAQYVWDHFKLACFADDTGLEIPALNNAPGVFSARYAGPQRSSEDNMDLVLRNLEGKNRAAQFRTVFALISDKETQLFEGKVLGEITKERQGGDGFGYDPIFNPENSEKTFGEMTKMEKSAISHRARALQKLLDHLKG